MSQPEPDELSAQLRRWQVQAQVPDGFQRQVWQRIAARQAARENTVWSRLLDEVGALFARPAIALAVVLLSFSGSVAYGRAKAQEANAHSWHDLEERYTLATNPLVRQVEHLDHLAP